MTALMIDLRKARQVCTNEMPVWAKGYHESELARFVARHYPAALWMNVPRMHRGWIVPLHPRGLPAVRCALVDVSFEFWQVGFLSYGKLDAAARFVFEQNGQGCKEFEKEYSDTVEYNYAGLAKAIWPNVKVLKFGVFHPGHEYTWHIETEEGFSFLASPDFSNFCGKAADKSYTIQNHVRGGSLRELICIFYGETCGRQIFEQAALSLIKGGAPHG
jgi:hypothetical protein